MGNIREPTTNYMIRDKVKPIWCRMLNSNKLEHWRHDVDPISSLDYYLHYRHCFQRIYDFRYFLNETSKFFFALKIDNFFTQKIPRLKDVIRFCLFCWRNFLLNDYWIAFSSSIKLSMNNVGVEALGRQKPIITPQLRLFSIE